MSNSHCFSPTPHCSGDEGGSVQYFTIPENRVSRQTMQTSEGFPHLLSHAGRVFVFIFLLAGGGCVIMTPVTAHPPSDMSVSYQEISRTLVVTITHPVPNPQSHYIREVHVTINGRTVNDSFYTSQPTTDT